MIIKPEFLVCKHCGNFVSLMEDKGVSLICCGEEMTKLEPNTVDAAVEKHVPVISVKDGILNVKIGSEPHPMIEKHYIKWIFICTGSEGQRKCFDPEDVAEHNFCVGDAEHVAAYAYCNIHGLWKTEI